MQMYMNMCLHICRCICICIYIYVYIYRQPTCRRTICWKCPPSAPRETTTATAAIVARSTAPAYKTMPCAVAFLLAVLALAGSPAVGGIVPVGVSASVARSRVGDKGEER